MHMYIYIYIHIYIIYIYTCIYIYTQGLNIIELWMETWSYGIATVGKLEACGASVVLMIFNA